MALLSRLVLRLVLLQAAVCSTLAWVDVVRIQTNFPKDVSAVESGDIAKRLSALEQTVTKRLTSIETMLKRLSTELLSDSGNLNLRRDIVTAIVQSDFTVAEHKLLELNNPSTVAEIVCDLMASSGHNLQLLLNLTQSVSETSVKVQILKSVYDELELSNRTSTLDRIALAKAISVDAQSADLNASAPFDRLIQRITVDTQSRLLSVLKLQKNDRFAKSEQSYEEDKEVKQLSAGIALWPDVSEKVMTGLVTEAFRTVENFIIFKAVISHSDPWQALVGLDTFIDMLKSRKSFLGGAVMEIASSLKDIMDRIDFRNEHQHRAQETMNKIPECTRNLILAPKFCILNKNFDAFLIATEYTDDSKRRRVWTSLRLDNTTTPKGAQWQLKRTSDVLRFESVDYPNEFLYSVESGEGSVHTPYAGEVEDSDSGSSGWILQAYGESCLLRNAATGKYLYTTNNNAGSKRFNFVSSGGQLKQSIDADSTLIWQMKTC